MKEKEAEREDRQRRKVENEERKIAREHKIAEMNGVSEKEMIAARKARMVEEAK